MSSDIEILDDEKRALSLEIGAKTIGIYFEDYSTDDHGSVFFDMSNQEDRNQLKKMISHLQLQLSIHEAHEV